jgi:hypothetical protein
VPLLPRHARSSACVSSREGSRVLLIGGPPFPETILMWWNFRRANAGRNRRRTRGLGSASPVRRRRRVSGPRLSAPSLVRLARPNPVS